MKSNIFCHKNSEGSYEVYATVSTIKLLLDILLQKF